MLDQFPSLLSKFGIWKSTACLIALVVVCFLLNEVVRPQVRLMTIRQASELSAETKLPPELVLPLVVPPADNKPLIGLAELKPKLKP